MYINIEDYPVLAPKRTMLPCMKTSGFKCLCVWHVRGMDLRWNVMDAVFITTNNSVLISVRTKIYNSDFYPSSNLVNFSVTVLEYRNSAFLSLSEADLDQILLNTPMGESTLSVDMTIGKAKEFDMRTNTVKVTRNLGTCKYYVGVVWDLILWLVILYISGDTYALSGQTCSNFFVTWIHVYPW